MRLVDLKVMNVSGQRRYSSVLRGGQDACGLWRNANWRSFREKWEERGKSNIPSHKKSPGMHFALWPYFSKSGSLFSSRH